MRKIVIALSVCVLITSSCGQATKNTATNGTTPQDSLYSVEDTVRRQIGGKLFGLTIRPSDSITVIETAHYQLKEGDLYREYHFIVHNRNSDAHHYFAESTLDSIYSSYKTDEDYCELYKILFKPRLDSIQTRRIDPVVKNFNGYWVYLEEYNGDFYLNDDWSWHSSFCIADSIFTNHYMDGPEPRKILEVTPVGSDDISISFGGDSLKIELVDKSRSIYRLISGSSIRFIAPARAIHHFEMIQYTNNTGDLI